MGGRCRLTGRSFCLLTLTVAIAIMFSGTLRACSESGSSLFFVPKIHTLYVCTCACALECLCVSVHIFSYKFDHLHVKSRSYLQVAPSASVAGCPCHPCHHPPRSCVFVWLVHKRWKEALLLGQSWHSCVTELRKTGRGFKKYSTIKNTAHNT